MPTTDQLRNRLLSKLKELFQLDQPDLDFGFFRVMHAKAEQVEKFIGEDLLQIVADAFESSAASQGESAVEAARAKLVEAMGDDALGDDGAVKPEFAATPAGKAYTAAVEKARGQVPSLSDEGQIYDHLYRFFERYYDNGDFISRRYDVRESADRAAPFSIPYHGEEVKLHWANADQYYIKTAEYFNNYRFDLTQASEFRNLNEVERAASGVPEHPVMVQFQIVDASEGEHGNVKAKEDDKRFFILHADDPIAFNDEGELIVRFEYRADPEKGSKQEGSWRQHRNAEAVEAILAALEEAKEENPAAATCLQLLQSPAPTEKDKKRPLLAKYLNQYTGRNTMDYFIHKDLGSFLRRELDFYIKNEVMRLDDLDQADAPAVETYLGKLKVLRKIARKLIDFLAQLEEFQKKLWLKKKFVVETNYCLTLDRVPEELYEEIAANDAQRDEWVKLFAIDGIEASTIAPGYSEPLTVGFLKVNDKLVLDTKFFPEAFKARLLEAIEDFDARCNGLLIQAENFQALNGLPRENESAVKCIYIDPPYNTGQDEFLYKDAYQGSSWISMLHDRLIKARALLNEGGAIAVSIDENEVSSLLRVMDDIFGKENRAGIATVKRGSVTGHKAINKGIVNITEYLVIYAFNKTRWSPQRAFKARDRNDRYNNFIKNRNESPESWEIVSLLDAFSEYKSIPKSKLKKTLSKNFESEIYGYVKENSESVIQLAYPDESNVSKDAQEAIRTSRKDKDNVHHFRRAGVPDMYLKGGQRLLFYADRLVEVDGEIVTAEPLSDIWDDILPNDLHNEGGVSLKKGKKPEKLLNRIYDICCESGDLVLDFFLGSGTTAATALKRGLRFVGVEQSAYFDDKAIYRLKLLNETRKKHEPEVDFCFKYVRLESYEDTLNNLTFDSDQKREEVVTASPALKEDYMLRYLLDVETRGSQSLLNIDAFADPAAYRLSVKKPGSDEQETRHVDLIETFNYLIGLRLVHLAAPRTFAATFQRETDPELPEDQQTKLVITGGIKQDADGPWWFRKVEGWVPKDPSILDHDTREKSPENMERVLIVWRKLTGDLEQDNAVLDEWFRKHGISTRDYEFDTIYVNGSNNLPNLKTEEEHWKVRLIEEEFLKRMWDTNEA